MRLKAIALTLLLSMAAITGLFAPAAVNAQTGANADHCGRTSAGFLGFPTWYQHLNHGITDPDGDGPAPASCNVEFEFTPSHVGAVLLAVFEIILRIAGIVAIVFVIWGGIQLQLSQGEPDRMSGARSTIINALIGLAIAISATAIVNLIARNIV